MSHQVFVHFADQIRAGRFGKIPGCGLVAEPVEHVADSILHLFDKFPHLFQLLGHGVGEVLGLPMYGLPIVIGLRRPFGRRVARGARFQGL